MYVFVFKNAMPLKKIEIWILHTLVPHDGTRPFLLIWMNFRKTFAFHWKYSVWNQDDIWCKNRKKKKKNPTTSPSPLCGLWFWFLWRFGFFPPDKRKLLYILEKFWEESFFSEEIMILLWLLGVSEIILCYQK